MTYGIRRTRKVLAVTVRFIQKDAEEKQTSFNPRQYFKLFVDWLLDLSTLDPVFEGSDSSSNLLPCPAASQSSCIQVLAVTVRFIQKDAEEKQTSFNPRQYFKLFVDWLLDLSTLDPVFEGSDSSSNLLPCPAASQSSCIQVLAVTVRFIQKDAEEKQTSFNPRQYFKLFVDWLLDLSTLDPVFEGSDSSSNLLPCPAASQSSCIQVILLEKKLSKEIAK
ncbi:unnamed protein product [Lactuca saligna]|uniref:Uncharacterized protein n=1 Tax=Lactuca saligna TaxID=75948 RepID=A0AA35YCW8_LACSI|nr:unnamed protein product [Lactuca saligna]